MASKVTLAEASHDELIDELKKRLGAGEAAGGDEFPTADQIEDMNSDKLDELCEKVGITTDDLDDDEKKSMLKTVYHVGSDADDIDPKDIKALMLAIGLKHVKGDDESNTAAIKEYLNGDDDAAAEADSGAESDADAAEETAEIEVGSEVTWNDDGDEKSGTVKSIKGDTAKVKDEDDEVHSVELSDLTLKTEEADADAAEEAVEIEVGDNVTWDDDGDEKSGTVKSIKGDTAKVKDSDDEVHSVEVSALTKAEAAAEEADADDEADTAKDGENDTAAIVAESGEYPKEAVMQKRLDAFNKVAGDDKINVKKAGSVKKAYALLLERLVDAEGNIADWETPYIRENDGWCCGLVMKTTKFKGDSEEYGKCLITNKVYSLDDENNFVEKE